MDNLGHYDTEEEIRQFVLDDVTSRKGNTKLAFIASKCANEAQCIEVINKMIAEGVITYDEPFLHI